MLAENHISSTNEKHRPLKMFYKKLTFLSGSFLELNALVNDFLDIDEK